MNWIFNILWVFAGILFGYIIYLLTITPKFLEVPLLVPLGVLISAALASVSMMKSIANTKEIESNKRKYDVSEFFMNKAMDNLDLVYNLLKDQNNDRVIWIQASRVLDEVFNLGKQITEDNHNKVYKLHEFQIKHKLRQILKNRGDEALPLSFFAGLRNWNESTREEALAEINGITCDKQLAAESVIKIYEFLKFPHDYNDPLENINIPETEEELDELFKGIPNFEVRSYLKLVREREYRS